MIGYPLAAIAKLRKRRVDLANKHLHLCRHECESRRSEWEQCEQDLRDYRHCRVREERNQFAKVKGKPLALKHLEDLKVEVSMMRKREGELESEYEQASVRLGEADSELEQARIDQAAAMRAEAKLLQHHKVWQKGLDRDLERKEEAALEDFRYVPNRLEGDHSWQ